MRFGSIYLIVRDFDKSVDFYEKIFDMKVSATNGKRFAMFHNEGLNLCLMNGYFDINNREKVKTKGEHYPIYDDQNLIADSENTKKVFINLSVNDLKLEYERVKSLNIADNLTSIRFIQYASAYWYFTFSDPDGNPIEITGGYEE